MPPSTTHATECVAQLSVSEITPVVRIHEVRILSADPNEQGGSEKDSLDSVVSSEATSASTSTCPSAYSIWLLFLCTFIYFLCQLHRYSLCVVPLSLEYSLHFGDGTGTDLSYQILVSIIFTHTFTGCALTIYGREWNRVWILTGNMIFACLSSVFIGLSRTYVEICLSRLLQGISQGGVSAFSSSLLSSQFTEASRSRAMSVFSIGVYAGYGTTYAVSAGMKADRVGSDKWREMFFLFAAPCAVVAVVLMATVKDREWMERKRKEKASEKIQLAQKEATFVTPLLSGDSSSESSLNESSTYSSPLDSSSSINANRNMVYSSINATNRNDIATPSSSSSSTASPSPVADISLSPFADSFRFLLSSPPVLILCLSSALRTGGGTVWGYNTKQFYTHVHHLSSDQIASYMSFIPVVFGAGGALVGGVCADWILKKYGKRRRVLFLALAQFAAVPFAFLTLHLSYPYTFLMFSLYLFIGESYIGVCIAILFELTPKRLHSFIVAVYIFILANLGGNCNLLLPPVQGLFRNKNGEYADLTTALDILWPGTIALSAIGYTVLWRMTKD